SAKLSLVICVITIARQPVKRDTLVPPTIENPKWTSGGLNKSEFQFLSNDHHN
ncbi:unnamed protein product, partial [Rotaria magnacalcarata]